MKRIIIVSILLLIGCARQVVTAPPITPPVDEVKVEQMGAVCLRISLPLKRTVNFHALNQLYIYRVDDPASLIPSDYQRGDKFYYFSLKPGEYHIAALEFPVKGAEEGSRGFFLLTERSAKDAAFSVTAGVIAYPGVLSGKLDRYVSGKVDAHAGKHLAMLLPKAGDGRGFILNKKSGNKRFMVLSNTILFYPYDDNTVQLIKRDLGELPNDHPMREVEIKTRPE
ncbi:MAG: hypothetical protein PF637_13375 [Spirochaetes bacterium]|nr:hypothetical protein [Spirochaetota bacterium]